MVVHALAKPLSDLVLRRLWRARVTTFEMLAARGWSLRAAPCSEEAFCARMLAQREDEVFANLAIHAQKPGKAGARAMVFFAAEPKVGIGTIRDLTAHCVEHDVQHAVLVYAQSITSFARARIDELARDAEVPITACELFTFDQLQLNPTKHIDVPPHTLLTAREVAALLARPGMSLDKLPRILSSDILVRFYGARRKDVFRIRRMNIEGLQYDAYRVVE